MASAFTYGSGTNVRFIIIDPMQCLKLLVSCLQTFIDRCCVSICRWSLRAGDVFDEVCLAVDDDGDDQGFGSVQRPFGFSIGFDFSKNTHSSTLRGFATRIEGTPLDGQASGGCGIGKRESVC